MSIIDLLTDATLDSASEGLAVLLVLLGERGVDPRDHMTPAAWEGLRAVAIAGAVGGLAPVTVAGAPDDEHAIAAAEGN